MDRRTFLGVSAAVAATVTLSGPAAAPAPGTAAGREVPLPAPARQGGRPHMACINDRRSKHRPGVRELSLEQVSSVLWAACGISDEKGRLTVPTAMNRRQLEVYAVLPDGVWRYLPEKHAIKRVREGDRRQAFDNSGCVLLYVAPTAEQFSAMHVGSMYQNVSLYCASAGLHSCVKYQKHNALDAELPLQQGWKTFITHSIAR